MKRIYITAALLWAAISSATAQVHVTELDSIADQNLEAAEVVAQKPLVKMNTDKLTYAVNQDADAKGSTVLDMLRKVPMVTVDGQDNIMVNGSTAFKIYVDGKPNAMFSSNPSQIFKSMPATMVKKIEVITNPGAKYDGEGTGGVLNIVLDRDALMGGGGGNAGINGVNGNVRLEGGNRNLGGSFFLSGQQGKFTFSTNVMLNKMFMSGTEVEMTQQQALPPIGGGEAEGYSTATLYQTNGRTRTPFGMANLSLGYEIDERSTLSATVDYNAFQVWNTGDLRNEMAGGLYGPGFGLNMYNEMKNRRGGVNASADYQRFFDDERESSLSVTYLFSRNPTLTQMRSEFDHSVAPLPEMFAAFLQDRYSDNHEHSTENTLQADYTTPLAEGHKLNVGAKATMHSNSSEADYYYGTVGNFVIQDELSSGYNNRKGIAAGYAEYEGKFGDFGTRAGVRYEHTWQSVEFSRGSGQGAGTDMKTNYGNFIPSLSLNYSPFIFANVGLTYNLRISRPGITYLNPYVDRSNNTSLTYGNPDLDVETSHNTGFVANFFTPKVIFSLNAKYVYTPNAIEKYAFYKDNLLHNTYGNIVERRNVPISLFASYLVHKNTRLFANAGATHVDMSSEQLAAHAKGWQYNLMFGLQQTFPLDIKGSLFLLANSKTYTLQGWNTGFNMVTANVSRTFLKDKLDVSLRATSGLSKGGRIHFDNYAEGSDFSSLTKISTPMASVSVSVTYKFGNAKVNVRKHTSKVKSDVIESPTSNQMPQMGAGDFKLEGIMK